MNTAQLTSRIRSRGRRCLGKIMALKAEITKLEIDAAVNPGLKDAHMKLVAEHKSHIERLQERYNDIQGDLDYLTKP